MRLNTFNDMEVDELSPQLLNGAGQHRDTAKPVRATPEETAAALEAEIEVNRCSYLAENIALCGEVPPKPLPLLRLGSHMICTQGNITNIQGQAKSAKSAVMGAMIAALVEGSGAVVTSFDPDTPMAHDTLFFVGERPEGATVLHFDTEQSRYDHYMQMARVFQRIGKEDVWHPAVKSFSLAAAPRMERLPLIRTAIEHYGGGSVLAIFIDGAADLMKNPNDIEEASQLVEELSMLARSLHIAIITVVHENSGSEVGKARGHLGSELERKVETNLRVQKDPAGISYIWAEKARNCDIPLDKGVAFSWDDEKHMHVTRGVAGVVKRESVIKARESKRETKELEREAVLTRFVESLNFPITRHGLKDAIEASALIDASKLNKESKRRRLNDVVKELESGGYVVADGVGGFTRHPIDDSD